MTRAELFERNKKRNGGKARCWICKELIDESKPKTWVKEHKDNNPKNNNPDNLDIAHRKCNYEKNPPNFYSLKGDSLDSVCVRGWVRVRQKAQFAEMAVSQARKGKFYKWFYSEMLKRSRIKKEEVINSGAFISALSPDTIKNRYLKPLCSAVAFCEVITETELDEEGNEFHIDYVHWRKGGREKFLKHRHKELFKKYSK